MTVRLPSFKSTQGFDSRVWTLFYGRIISALGYSIVMPFLAIYLHDDLKISMTMVGIVLLISAIVGSVGQIIGGELADIFGRKKIMVLAMAARSLTFLSLAYIISGGADLMVIAVMVSMSSLFGSLFEPATNAMIADVVPSKKRLEAYGLLRVGGNLGWTLGPLLGGLMAMISFPFLFLISALATGTVSFIVLFLVAESISPSSKRDRFSFKDMGRIRKDHRFIGFAFISVFLFIMFGQMASTFAVFSTSQVGISSAELGYLYALNGIMVVLIQFPIARAINHYRMTRVIAFGSLLYAIGYGVVGFAPGLGYLAMCMFVVTMGEIIVSPSAMALVAKMSPEKERGRYQGMYGLVSNFGFSAGPFFGGVLYDSLVNQPVLLWAGIGSFGLMAAIGFLILSRWLPLRTDRVDDDE
ncbi:MAG: MFS transporter [Methanomassiliicoccus sp.]|nr:MAG: MFS transporter [Methanomassiliicoccus sp.]